VVVNFNGGDDLPRCLEALSAQTVPVEVVLVDCASTDGSRRLALGPPSGVVGVPLPGNVGFAGGCAEGLDRVEEGVEVIGFFNPDCFPQREFFAACVDRLREDSRAGGVAARLLREDGQRLDSCGQVLSGVLLRVRDRGYDRLAAGAFTSAQPVLSACGAAMVYRRGALRAAAVDGEIFPRDWFAYWEDVDLGWRVGNAGLSVVYEPRAVAVHRRGGTASPGRGRMIFRRSPELVACILVNRWAALLRNLDARDLWPRLPALLPVELGVLALVLARRPRALAAVRSAWPRVSRAARQRGGVRRRRLAELQ
jgi:hypothetical protein